MLQNTRLLTEDANILQKNEKSNSYCCLSAEERIWIVVQDKKKIQTKLVCFAHFCDPETTLDDVNKEMWHFDNPIRW